MPKTNDAPDAGARWTPTAGELTELRSREGACHASAARRAARAITAAYDRALAPTGLKVGQFGLLHVTALHGPLSLVALAELRGMNRTTLSRNVQPLTRDGLLQVTTSSSDRRVREVRVTKAGADRLERAIPLWEKAQSKFEHRLGADRAARLRDELNDVAGRDTNEGDP